MSKKIYTQEDVDRIVNAVQRSADETYAWLANVKGFEYTLSESDVQCAAHNCAAVAQKERRELLDRPASKRGMARLEAGFYTDRLPNGQWLNVFKFNRRWYYTRTMNPAHPQKRASMYLNDTGHRSYPTRAMAIAAGRGECAS